MKIRNKAVSAVVIAVLLLTFLLSFTALAAEGSLINGAVGDLARVPLGERLPRFVDDEELLTEEQAKTLIQKLDTVSEHYQFDTVVAVVPKLDEREARVYAIDFFEQNGFGFGEELDGIILILATQDRDFGFAVYGYGLEVFTDSGQEYLEELFLPHLKENRYYEAFMAYADGVDDFLKKAGEGEPYDKGSIPITVEEKSEQGSFGIIFSLVVAFLIALIVTSMWKAQLTSVRKENYARAYIRDGSKILNRQDDIFLNRQITKTKRAESSSSGGGGSSGSFSSSSGRSSSGRSGKY